MKKDRLFYVIQEHTDVDKYCKRKGFKPQKKIVKVIEDISFEFEVVVQYSRNGQLYDVLDGMSCYSGFMVTLMKLPKLSYDELLNLALTADNLDETAGAIGIILKECPEMLEKYLSEIADNEITDKIRRKQIARIVSLIYNLIRVYVGYTDDLENIFCICEKLKDKYKLKFPHITWR